MMNFDPKWFTHRLPFVAIGLAALVPTFGMSIANVALPTLSIEFAQPLSLVQWVVSAYLLAMTIFSLVAGRLSDRFGARFCLLGGYLCFLVGALICWVAADLFTFIVGRALQGAGAAFLAVVAIALARTHASKNSIGKTMGLLGTMTAIGTALGPSIGGGMIEAFGWRSLFVLLISISCVGIVFVALVINQGAEERRVNAAKKVPLKFGQYVFNATANCLVAVMMMTTFIVGPFFLTYVLGYGEGRVGLVMALGPLISMFAGFPSGVLVDRLGTFWVMIVGLFLVFAGALSFAFLPLMTGVLGYILALIVLTPGYQMFLSANNTSVMGNVPDDHRGMVSGLLNMSRNAGLIFGASAISILFTFGAGSGILRNAPIEAIEKAFQLVFLVNAALIVCAFAVLQFSRLDRDEREEA